MKVSWDDDIPNIWNIIKFMFQTTNQIHSMVVSMSIPPKLETTRVRICVIHELCSLPQHLLRQPRQQGTSFKICQRNEGFLSGKHM